MHNLVITSVHVISSIIVIGVDISNTVRGSYSSVLLLLVIVLALLLLVLFMLQLLVIVLVIRC